MGNIDNMTLTWTDAECAFTHVSDSDVNSDCEVTVLSGADNSRITVVDSFMRIDGASARVVYSPGYSIGKSGTGKIGFSGGGQIQKAYLYWVDTDGDNYGTSTLSSGVSATAPAGKIRASSNPSASDCCDALSTVKPGQTTYFTSAMADCAWDYDYNCDSVEDTLYDEVSSSFCSGCSQPPGSVCVGSSTDFGWWQEPSVGACGTSASVIKVTGGCEQTTWTQACR